MTFAYPASNAAEERYTKHSTSRFPDTSRVTKCQNTCHYLYRKFQLLKRAASLYIRDETSYNTERSKIVEKNYEMASATDRSTIKLCLQLICR